MGSLPVGFTCKEGPQMVYREHEEGIVRLGLPVCGGVFVTTPGSTFVSL